jgi:dCTP deaminase
MRTEFFSELSRKDILKALDKKTLRIHNFDRSQVAQSSIDLRLSPYLLVTKKDAVFDWLRPSRDQFTTVVIPEEGFVIEPWMGVLASTVEVFECGKKGGHNLRFMGKSSGARLFLTVETAGKVEYGFQGPITAELSVKVPLRVYAGMWFAQVEVGPYREDLESYEQRGSYTDAYLDVFPQVSRTYTKKLGGAR